MEGPASGPATIPFHDGVNHEPRTTFVNQSRNGAGWTTAIARLWGEPPRRCGLCPAGHCNLTDGACLVTVQAYVSDDDAPAFSLTRHLAPARPADHLGPGRCCDCG